jgi:hypothetical protein
VRREPRIFLVGAALTIAYVGAATLVGWDAWLIAVVGLGLGFAYALIATPLALGPGLHSKTVDAPLNPKQMRIEALDVGSFSTWAAFRRATATGGRVGTPLGGNGAP